ncbi:hypothetical protein [Auritidibacter sp. NML100628]|uniref:hypothetical protein n=1 Tax=Auritidibacter sp. NML100628 TaxID=2170742 RepID=UPI0018F1F3E6|nr:hypothetical protein [Auritidibacter sp. NML100628]
MRDLLWEHLRDYVAKEAKAPVIASSFQRSVPLSNTRWWNVWNEAKDAADVVDSGFRSHDLRHTGLTIIALARRRSDVLFAMLRDGTFYESRSAQLVPAA